MMDSTDLDDSHLCIKCNATIVGLEKYIEHRKHNCINSSSSDANDEKQRQGSDMSAAVISTASRTTAIPTTMIDRTSSNSLHHSYDSFTFAEPEAPTSYVNKTEHGGKTAKNLTEAYDLTYELGADVFFSSLQLQSVQSSGPSTSGKTSSSSGDGPITRQKSQSEAVEDHQHQVDEPWISQHTSGTDTLLKAISYMSDAKKHYESDYKTMKLAQIVTDITSDEEEEDDEEGVEFENDDDDADYDPRVDALAMGVKWKLSPMRHSPPTVPASHTGGKWKPEHRPTLPVTHMTRLSPNWDEQADDLETPVETEVETHNQHPPAEHTKGKWVPGSKVQRLEYRENVDLTVSMPKQSYWCNICCRKLKNKIIYDQHLRTSYHLKRAEPEQLLEKATLKVRPQDNLTIDDNFTAEQTSSSSARPENEGLPKKRKRRAIFIKCELCKHIMQRHQIGKHLISHYHYRRMQGQPKKPALLHMILDNMHTIVLQSPYQCRPCSFYANTEEAFAQHWLSNAHSQKIQGPGRFWCSYCQFECNSNEQMYDHLLGPQHREVILLINRSVPICINKRLIIDCSVCGTAFRYNAELRQHFATAHPNVFPTGGASDVYQSRFICNYCGEVQRSRIALQRHEKFKHSVAKYHCGICKLEFSTAMKALRHRKSMAHKHKAAANKVQSKKLTHQKVSAKLKDDTAHMENILHEMLADSSMDVVPNANAEQPLAKDVPLASYNKLKISKSICCQICTMEFESKESLKQHQIIEHSMEHHECMLCNQSFLTPQALGRHSRSCQPKASTSAAASVAANEQFTQLPNPSQQKLWNCAECTFSAAYESDLYYHNMLHANQSVRCDQLLKCPLCPKSFRKHSLRCHLRLHTNEKIFECEMCQLKFARRANLKNHLTTMHSENSKTTTAKQVRIPKIKTKEKEEKAQIFACNVCGKELASKYTLKMHTMNHTQTERRFQCTHEGCQYAGSTQHILNIHLASHSQQSFMCDFEHCNYVGKSSMHLKRHQQSHAKRLKMFNCDQCDFKTALKRHLNRHLARHTGQKPHQCPYCDFRCNGFDNLRKHILKTGRHPGKFMYECEICNQSPQTEEHFKTNSFVEYQSHITNVHGANNTRNLN